MHLNFFNHLLSILAQINSKMTDITAIEGLPDIPETSKARINLCLTSGEIELQKIKLMVNHDMSPEEHEQRTKRLERLYVKKDLEEKIVLMGAEKDPFHHLQRISETRDEDWYNQHALTYEIGEDGIEIVEIEETEDDKIIEQITNVSTNVQVHLKKGHKRKIIVSKPDRNINEPGPSNLVVPKIKKKFDPLETFETPEKQGKKRTNAFQNAKNKIFLFKTCAKDRSEKDHETKKKITKAKNEILDYETAVNEFVKERGMGVLRMQFTINGKVIDPADHRLHNTIKLPVLTTGPDGEPMIKLESSDALFTQMCTLVQTKPISGKPRNQETRIDRLVNYSLDADDFETEFVMSPEENPIPQEVTPMKKISDEITILDEGLAEVDVELDYD